MLSHDQKYLQNISNIRVKLSHFGYTLENSGNPVKMARNVQSHWDFHCLLSYLIFIPIVAIWNTQGRCPNLAVRPNIPYFTPLIFNNDVLYFYEVHVNIIWYDLLLIIYILKNLVKYNLLLKQNRTSKSNVRVIWLYGSYTVFKNILHDQLKCASILLTQHISRKQIMNIYRFGQWYLIFKTVFKTCECRERFCMVTPLKMCKIYQLFYLRCYHDIKRES